MDTGVQRIVMFGKSWTDYERLLEIKGEKHYPSVSFLDGELELVSPSWDHDTVSRNLGILLALYAYKHEIEITAGGSWTLKRKLMKAGAEPDECFVFGEFTRPPKKPDLVIEVVRSRGGIDKLEIYRRIGVPEVWYWDAGEITVYVLGRTRYTPARRSRLMPELDLELLCSFLDRPTTNKMIRAFTRALRKRR